MIAPLARPGPALKPLGDKASPDRRPTRAIVLSIAVLATIFLAVGIWVSWHMGSKVDWSARVLSTLPAMLLLGFGSYGFRFLRWHGLARRVAPNLGWWDSLRIYMAGFSLGLTPGRLGEFLKFSLLRDVSGVSELESVSILPLERATEATSFFLVALTGAVLGHLQVRHVGLATIAAICLLPCLAALPIALRLLLKRRASATDNPTSYTYRLQQILRGLLSIAGIRSVGLAVLCALIARSCDAVLFWLATRTVDLSIPLAGAALAWGLAGLVGGLSLLPAGVGAVEASLVATVVGLGGDGAYALAAALLARLVTLWIWVPAGLWFAFRGMGTGEAGAVGTAATDLAITPLMAVADHVGRVAVGGSSR